MILLQEIAKKLENVLNNVDSEIIALNFSNPTDYQFVVEAEGFHLDRIYDNKTHKNFIPVFISSLGGDYDPIPNMVKATQNIQVQIYFPVRFKNDFFVLGNYLAQCFVGRYLNYGTNTGKCLSTISVAQYGEIQSLDLKAFENWVGNTYKLPIDVMENYMSMTFSLYLQSSPSDNSGASYIYGNSVSYNLEITYKDDLNVSHTISEDLRWGQSGTGASISPISQQLIDNDKFVKNIPNITNFNKSMMFYIRNNTFGLALLDLYNKQELDKITNITLKKTYTFGANDTKEYTYNQVALSFNENAGLGDLISFTITFGD